MLFKSPEYFHLLFALPVLTALFILAGRWRKKALAAFADPVLAARLSSAAPRSRGRLKQFLVLSAWVFLTLALARPLFGTRMEVVPRKGVDIAVALDVSVSMLAEDIRPNRIKRAKYEIGKLLNKLKGDRAALVAFAGTAFIQCPLTADYGAVNLFLDILDPASIPSQGTALGAALRKAADCFGAENSRHKVVLLITDGEETVGDPVAEARKAGGEGVIVYCVGVGSDRGVPIPVGQSGGGAVYKKDREGNTVLTVLNEALLQEIATAGNGKYFRSTGGGLELNRIHGEIEKLEKAEYETTELERYNERFIWPLALAFLLIAAEAFLPSRRRKKTAWEGRFQE